MNDPSRVLVVDDEEQILRVLEPSLEAAGYSVTTACNGAKALEQLALGGIDAMILDLGLPDMDGKAIIGDKARTGSVPIIVLSARGSEQEKIDALDLGANDYVAKPFAVGELLARLRVALRTQRTAPTPSTFKSKGFDIDFVYRRMTINRSVFRLSARETELMKILVAARGAVVTHDEIIAAVWPGKGHADTQYVRVLVNQLRQKIGVEPCATRMLVTEPGHGYRLALPYGNW